MFFHVALLALMCTQDWRYMCGSYFQREAIRARVAVPAGSLVPNIPMKNKQTLATSCLTTSYPSVPV